MAGSDSQKQFLTLLRNFTTEKSQGERRIVSQKKQIEELRSELDAENKALEEAKRDKENTEQELKGYDVELSMADSSIQALQARIDLINNEISKLGAEAAALKSEDDVLRDGFIEKMLELNTQIRNFQESVASTFNAENFSEAIVNGGSLTAQNQDASQANLVLENKLAEMILHADQEEQQYQAELVIRDQLQQELINLERKAFLMESLMKENKGLEELSGQTSELEEKCAALGEELQRRFLCPRCQKDNSGELGETLK